MSLYPLFDTWDTKYVTVSNTWAIKDTVTSYLTKYTLCNATVSPCHTALSQFVIALCSVVFCEVPCTVLLIPFCVLYCVVDVFLEREQLVPFLKWSQQVTISVGKEKSYERKGEISNENAPFVKWQFFCWILKNIKNWHNRCGKWWNDNDLDTVDKSYEKEKVKYPTKTPLL